MAETFILHMGWIADHKTKQPVPDVNLRKCQGSLPMQAHSYTKRETRADHRDMHSHSVG